MSNADSDNDFLQMRDVQRHLRHSQNFLVASAAICFILLQYHWYIIFPFTIHSIGLGLPTGLVAPLALLPLAIHHAARANQLRNKKALLLLWLSWVALAAVTVCISLVLIAYVSVL